MMTDQDKKHVDKPSPTSFGVLAEPGLGGGTSLASMMHTGLGIDSPFMREIYLKKQVIVGMRYQGGSDELIQDLEPGSRVTFLREPDNQFDPNAIMALDKQGRKLGYIPRRENELMGSLMGAGKYFFGIVREKPEGENHTGTSTPYSLWLDLYMREFARPDDLTQIPRQGASGSYAVVDLESSICEGETFISGIYAIKVINGEARKVFQDTLEETAELEMRGNLIRDFNRFIGYLPVVGHDIEEKNMDVLKEAYGVFLGKPWSNHVIDTMQMARNHLPDERFYSLDRLAELLGINVLSEDSGENRCHTIWELYRRMDRSDLEKKEAEKTADPHKGIAQGNASDIPLSFLPLTERTRRRLKASKIDTVWELTRYSREELSSLVGLEKETLKEIESVLNARNDYLRPANVNKALYRYPDDLDQIIKEHKGYWEYLLFADVLSENLSRVQCLEVLRDENSDPAPQFIYQEWNDSSQVADFASENLKIIQNYAEEIIFLVNEDQERAFGKPGEPGNVEVIIEFAERLSAIYKAVIYWMIGIDNVHFSSKYAEGIRDFTGYGEDICRFYHDMLQWAQSCSSVIRDYYAGKIEEEDLSLDIHFSLTFEPWRADKLQEALQGS